MNFKLSKIVLNVVLVKLEVFFCGGRSLNLDTCIYYILCIVSIKWGKLTRTSL